MNNFLSSVATLTIIFVGWCVYCLTINILDTSNEWRRVAENINRTFEEIAPHDIDANP